MIISTEFALQNEEYNHLIKRILRKNLPNYWYMNLNGIIQWTLINLGFSGNGKLDYEIAGTMAKRHDAALFILDFIPNVNEEQIKEKTATFVSTIVR